MKMIEPPISELLKKVDSKYTLVIATAMRARQLVEGDIPLVECDSKKSVSIAIKEIYAEKVEYHKI